MFIEKTFLCYNKEIECLYCFSCYSYDKVMGGRKRFLILITNEHKVFYIQ